MFPQKLKSGDEIRVIAPSGSFNIISDSVRDIAIERLKDMGLKVTYSAHAEESDECGSSLIASRTDDLHEAFADKNVKGILTAIGGFNTNQILDHLDYHLIKENPKILCGFSDITALANAIYAKTGLVTYSGPHFSSFGMLRGIEYTVDYFKKCLMSEGAFDIAPSAKWSDDAWFLDQERREFVANDGYVVINEGNAEGYIIGGNLCTLNLLQGTEFMPNLEGSVLFLEEDDLSGKFFGAEFDRNLQSLIHQSGFSGVRGVVIGRFQKRGNIERDMLVRMMRSKKKLGGIPIIYGVDFGHTTPIITFPIGGRAGLIVYNGQVRLEILKH